MAADDVHDSSARLGFPIVPGVEESGSSAGTGMREVVTLSTDHVEVAPAAR